MPNPNTPFHPIIYVRGYAMTQGEIDETTADPFCGFNLGSTVYRAVSDSKRPPRKFIFESPIVRLASTFKYRDVFEDGYDILDPDWTASGKNKLSSRSIVIFRYYDQASRLLGSGETPPIGTFARDLGALIRRVRELVCANPENGVEPADFRCHLVAHSMGGLVCRAFLQNPDCDPAGERQYVDKLFTYATPHNGIEMAGLNVPSWLTKNELATFNRESMSHYLALREVFQETGRVDWIPEDRFPTRNVFCMVGTNRTDYEVALGLARTFVGHGSDGLVRIENATLCGLKPDRSPGEPCAKAFAYRSHSGFFGIVNSEEAYQNLTRFLFGDVRVDVWVDLEDLRLPKEVQADQDAGKTVDALYQIEVIASPRGKLWYLTRRTAEEDSVACLSHQDWAKGWASDRSLYVSTVILANRAKVSDDDRSLSYSLALGIRTPDYEVERRLWVNQHYEGGYLFRDSIIILLVPPLVAGDDWEISHAWQGQGSKRPQKRAVAVKELTEGRVEMSIDFDSKTTPGAKGKVRFVVSAWNPDAVLSE